MNPDAPREFKCREGQKKPSEPAATPGDRSPIRRRPELLAERIERENPRQALIAACLMRPQRSTESQVLALHSGHEVWSDAREPILPFKFCADAYGWPGHVGPFTTLTSN